MGIGTKLGLHATSSKILAGVVLTSMERNAKVKSILQALALQLELPALQWLLFSFVVIEILDQSLDEATLFKPPFDHSHFT